MESWYNSSSRGSIIFKAGDNFAVTDEGHLFANEGTIGSMTIESLNSRVEGIVNKNLAINTADNRPPNLWGFNETASALDGTSGLILTNEFY
jgi:hypothetical protein